MAKVSAQFGRRRGTALIMVLWLMTILAALALEATLFSRLRLQATRNSADAMRARFLARAGVERAVSDLGDSTDCQGTLEDLREDEERAYHNVELGEGSYTLLAEMQDAASDEPEYGISDEAAKLNLNTADKDALAGLADMDQKLAADILALRKKNEKIHDLGDLLLIEGVTPLVLYGEDQNRDGLLGPNEDDGDASWPPDDRDGQLTRGLAAYLTCFSVARNVTADGEKRVDINTADAEAIAGGVPGISQRQAKSIVAHREKQKLESVVGLLDVMLVKQSEDKAKDGKDEKNGDKDESKGSPSRPEKGESDKASDESLTPSRFLCQLL